MVTMSTIRRRVNRGIAKLNALSPGWAKKVDPDKLDLSHFKQCVLGQTFGTFEDGYKALGFSTCYNPKNFEGMIHLGVALDNYWDMDMVNLTNFWKRQIRRLQAA